MHAAVTAAPTPEEVRWATDTSTPATVLAQLALFPALRTQVREHPSVYPDLIAWIDAQTETPDAAAPPAGEPESTGRRPLMIAVGVAAVTLAGAGVMLGVVQPWAPVASTAEPLPTATVGAVTPPTAPATEAPAAAVAVTGTVVVSAGANVRVEPSASSAKIGAFSHNAVVDIGCYARGDSVTDALGTTDVWYAVDGGYISAAILQASDPDAVMPCA